MEAARRGFTLLELLIAITVLTLVMAIVYESFASVTDTTNLARTQAAQIRFQQYVWRNLSTNLGSVYTDPALREPDFALKGTDEEGPFGAADSLRFCTALPMSGAYALPGVQRVVTYAVVPPEDLGENAAVMQKLTIDTLEEDEPPQAFLVIREEPLVLAAADFTGEASDEATEAQGVQEQVIPIRSFDVEYYDADAEEWVFEWDSSAEQRLPWAVRVKINFVRGQDQVDAELNDGIDIELEPDVDFMAPVQIAVGTRAPFEDPNHWRNGTEADGDLLDKPDAKTGAS